MKPVITALLLVPLLTACSDGELSATSDQATSEAERPTMETRPYNPWQDQMRAMDKARGVEETLREGARERDRQLRQMEQ